MTQMNTPLRPALAAIAAVLACSSTHAFAQDIGAASTPQTTAPAPAPVVPSAAPAAAASPAPVAATPPLQTVQSLPPPAPKLPDLGPLEESAPAAAKAARAEAAPRTTRTVERTPAPAEKAEAQPAPQAAAAEPMSPASADTQPIAEPIPPLAATGQAGSTSDIAPATTAAPADTPRATAADQPGDGALWAAVGAGALLLVGGAAVASRRRRPEHDIIDDRERVIDPDRVAPAEPVIAPVAAPTPAPAAATAPKPVIAPVTARRDVGEIEPGSRFEMVDRMASESPSAANPFLTRRNRRRRADFLLRTGAVEGATAPAEAATVATTADRIQPDRYGSFQIGGRLAPRAGRRVVPG